MFWWPPIESKYEALEKEIIKIHTYDTPCIIVIPTTHVAKKYYDWIKGELE
ncbi:MAG: divalent cation tolerance protein CutA [Patescibacteria group bacterium]